MNCMQQKRKSPTLMSTYYRSFVWLIVVPLVSVFLLAEIVIGYIVRNSAIETIDAFQENVATVLSNDMVFRHAESRPPAKPVVLTLDRNGPQICADICR